MTTLYDPTETYEAWKEREADMYFEEQRINKHFKPYMDYMFGYHLVNREEVYWAAEEAYKVVNNLWEDYEVSYSELANEVEEIADRFIDTYFVKFDEDWNITSMETSRD